MKICDRWLTYLLLLALAVLGARLAWTLTRSTTGWKPHLDHWANIATGLVGIETTALTDRAPELQAEFWLSQVRNSKTANTEAQVAMGAAWMLDAPQFGFIRNHFVMKESVAGLPASARRELDYETIHLRIEDFELRCRRECLAKIDTAVQLDSENVELWRALALLSFQNNALSSDMKPRRDDWLAVLDECSEHDPNNALYDYLAALQMLSSSSSAEYDVATESSILKIEDRATFEQANARLTAGLAKLELKFGADGFGATMAFLEQSSIALTDQLTAAASRQIDGRATSVLHGIRRWQRIQIHVGNKNKNLDAAITSIRNVLRISDQITEAGNYPNLADPKLYLRRWSLAYLKEMNEDHPNLLNSDEAQKVSVEFGQVQLDTEVLQEAFKRMAAKAGTSILTAADSPSSVAVFLVVTAQMLVIVAVGMALFSWLGARLFGVAGDDEQVEMGWIRHVTAWILAGGVSFVLLGMFPAAIVPPSVQAWLVYGLCGIGLVAVLLGLLYLLHLFAKRFQLPWAQLTALATITALPLIPIFHLSPIVDVVIIGTGVLHPIVSILLLLVLVLIAWQATRSLSAFVRNEVLSRRRKFLALGIIFSIALGTVATGPALAVMMSDTIEERTWISPTVWPQAARVHIAARELQSTMGLDDSKWVWAFLQWQVNHGAVVAPLFAAVVLLVWYMIRQVRRVEGGLRQILRSQKRRQIRLAGNVVARSFLVASLVFLLPYLGVTPTIANMLETYYRVHRERMVNPSHGWNEIAAASSQVRADESLMAKLKVEIAKRNRQIAESKAWQDKQLTK